MESNILVTLAVVIVLGILAQWIAARLRIPSILLLLISGLLAGPVLGWVQPDKTFGDLLFPVISLAVALILFEGGLSLRLSELHPVGHVIRNLITTGALVTWVVLAAAAYFILGFSLPLASLLAAILVVTGPTVIGPLLREVRPTSRIYSILKWEGIIIDPIGALLAVLVYEVIASRALELAPGIVLLGVAKTAVFGALIGLAGAALMVVTLRFYLAPDFLQNPLAMMTVIGAFTLSNQIQPESGLFAVTVMGLSLANQRFVNIGHIVEFKENLRVLLLSGLFVVLAARFQPADLSKIGWRDLAFVAVSILVARPLSVIASTIRSGLTWREKAFVSWMAPRGIVAASVSAVFSIRLSALGYPESARLATVTFLVIVVTVALYGLTSLPVARLLRVAQPRPEGILLVGAHPWARAIARQLQQQGLRAVLIDTNPNNVRAARQSGLEAFPVSAISEEALEELELEGVGRLLALTSNDEVNSLSALRFTEAFGRSEVYQLPEDRVDGVTASGLRGRTLFGPDVNFSYLNSRFNDGMEVRAIPIDEKLSDGELAGRYGELVKMFLVDPRGRLMVYTADNPPPVSPGQTLIALVKRGTVPEQIKD